MMKSFQKTSLAFAAMLLIAAHSIDARSATAPIKFPYDPSHQILTDMARKGYSETFEDLHVKVLGGYISFRRTLVGSNWYFNRRWSPARATSGCGGKKITRNDYVYFYAGTETVDYEGQERQADIFGYFGDKRIVGIQDPDQPPPVSITPASGSSGSGGGGAAVFACTEIPVSYLSLRWEDSFGNWIEYDGESGRILRYGDRNDVTVSFSYDASGNRSGVFDHFGNQILTYEYQTFSSQGIDRLVSITDPDNRRVQYVWSANGSTLDKVIDVRGNEWTVAYDSSNRIERIVDPEGRQKLITLNAAGGVESVDMAEPGETTGVGKTFEYGYDSANVEFTVTHELTGGRVETTVYDKYGYVIRFDVNGTTIYTVEVLDEGRRRVRTEHNGNRTINEYDERNNRIRQTFADGTVLETSYSEFSQPLRIRDQVGTVTLFEYDESGNLERLVEAAGTNVERIREFEYDQYGQLTLVRFVGDQDTVQAELAATYDAKGNLETLTDAEGGVATFTHDVMGNILTTTDRRNKTWTSTYDAAGNLRTASDPLGHVQRYEFDGSGYLTKIIDPADYATRFEYDARGNAVAVINELDEVFSLSYDENNRVTRTVRSSGRTELWQRDASGREIQYTDGAGNVSTLDYQNKEVSENGAYDHANKISSPKFDRFLQFNRRQRLEQDVTLLDGATSLVTEFDYDAAGRLVQKTDPVGNTTTIRRDAIGRVGGVTFADDSTIAIASDDRNNPIRLTNQRGKESRFTYDRNNRVVAERLPLGQTTTLGYDAEGNLTSITDAVDKKVTYEFDDAGRMTTERHFAASNDTTAVETITYSYNSRDLMTGWSDGQASAVIEHDELGRLVSETTSIGALTFSYSFTYGPDDLVDTFTDVDGTTYRFLYDADDKPSGVIIPNVGAVTVNSFDWRAPSRITLPGGTTREIASTDLLEPSVITIKDPAGNPISELSATYDDTRNIDTRQTPAGTSDYDYDKVRRLVSATNTWRGDQSFELDSIGNRTGVNGEPGTWLYDDNDRLITDGISTFTYDDNGNLRTQETAGVQTVYSYDVRNRLVRIETGDGTVVAEYGYDPFDRRLWKEVGGNRTYFVHSTMGLIGEFTDTGSPIRAYGYLPRSLWMSDPVYVKAGSNYYFYHNDQIGTPVLITDISGRVVWEAETDPFGNVNLLNNTIDNPLRFAGQYYDAESGLHYNWRRYYDPSIGRYITADPIGVGGGPNLYAYVDGNPINAVDPTGEWWWAVFGGANLGYQLYKNDGNFDCVSWVDVGVSALGGRFFQWAFRRAPGYEWSHWIPDRLIRPLTLSGKNKNKYYIPWLDKYFGWFVRSRFNGNFVATWFHAKTDPFRNIKGMTRADKWPGLIRQILRIPAWLPGTLAMIYAFNDFGEENVCGCE